MIAKLVYSVNSSIYSGQRKNTYSSDIENNAREKEKQPVRVADKQTKMQKEGSVFNSPEINIERTFRPEYLPSAPVSDIKKSPNVFMETLINEMNNLNEFGELFEPDQIIISAEAENAANTELQKEKGYIISMPALAGDAPDQSLKKIKEHNPVFEKYNLHKKREPGILVNLSI